jgi:RNA-directed DNA polymerase
VNVSLRKLAFDLGVGQHRLREMADRAGAYYRSFDVRALGSSKWRHIEHPQEPLRSIQTKILRRVLEFAQLPLTMTGGLPGRSLLDHARPHCFQQVVMTLDLAHCFPSISHQHVFQIFHKRLNFSSSLAGLLTKLTTLHRRLPQGAPTSPYLAALATEPLHIALAEFSKQNGLRFTQFIDDLAFSGSEGSRALLPAIVSLIQAKGFALSRKKAKVMSGDQRQVVTGIIVNRGLSAGTKRLNEIKATIGYHRDSLFILVGERRSLEGKLAFVESVRPTQAERLWRFALQCLPSTALFPVLLTSSTVERRDCNSSGAHELRPREQAQGPSGVSHQTSLPGLGRRAFQGGELKKPKRLAPRQRPKSERPTQLALVGHLSFDKSCFRSVPT